LVGQVKLTGAAGGETVNVAVHVTGGSQPLFTVKMTVAVPPQASGAPVLLLVKTALQPPVKLAVASQVLYLVLMAACDWQATSVVLIGHVKTTAGAAATVKLDEQDAVLLQSSVIE
jgi:hypothetical protein